MDPAPPITAKSSPNILLPNVLNSSSLNISVSAALFFSFKRKSSSLKLTGTLVMMVASFLLIMADFLPARTFSPIEPVILSAFSKTPSNVPYNFKSLAAVFSPTPGIPGILSEASPIKPSISTTCSTLSISHFSHIFFASTISSLLPNAGGFHIYTLGCINNCP